MRSWAKFIARLTIDVLFRKRVVFFMHTVSFEKIHIGSSYSRHDLVEFWGYKGFEALARGVITPAGHNLIILFVTESKRSSDEQYSDSLAGKTLHWEGPKDHYAEQRMIEAAQTGDEIHLFYRQQHIADFTYYGRLLVECVERQTERPSHFKFIICDQPA